MLIKIESIAPNAFAKATEILLIPNPRSSMQTARSALMHASRCQPGRPLVSQFNTFEPVFAYRCGDHHQSYFKA